MAKQSQTVPQVETTAAAATKRPARTRSFYLDGSGNETKDVREAAGVSIEVLQSGEEPIVVLEQNVPAAIRNAALWFGLQTKLTNGLGGLIKKDGPSAGYDAMAEIWEAMQNGEWSQRGAGEGGPRISLLVEAATNVYRAAGKDEEFLAAIPESIKAMDEDSRKAFADNRQIKAEVEKLKAERAAERAAKAQAEAEGDESLPDL